MLLLMCVPQVRLCGWRGRIVRWRGQDVLHRPELQGHYVLHHVLYRLMCMLDSDVFLMCTLGSNVSLLLECVLLKCILASDICLTHVGVYYILVYCM